MLLKTDMHCIDSVSSILQGSTGQPALCYLGLNHDPDSITNANTNINRNLYNNLERSPLLFCSLSFGCSNLLKNITLYMCFDTAKCEIDSMWECFLLIVG